jgi:hypothetical protein
MTGHKLHSVCLLALPCCRSRLPSAWQHAASASRPVQGGVCLLLRDAAAVHVLAGRLWRPVPGCHRCLHCCLWALPTQPVLRGAGAPGAPSLYFRTLLCCWPAAREQMRWQHWVPPGLTSAVQLRAGRQAAGRQAGRCVLGPPHLQTAWPLLTTMLREQIGIGTSSGLCWVRARMVAVHGVQPAQLAHWLAQAAMDLLLLHLPRDAAPLGLLPAGNIVVVFLFPQARASPFRPQSQIQIWLKRAGMGPGPGAPCTGQAPALLGGGAAAAAAGGAGAAAHWLPLGC